MKNIKKPIRKIKEYIKKKSPFYEFGLKIEELENENSYLKENLKKFDEKFVKYDETIVNMYDSLLNNLNQLYYKVYEYNNDLNVILYNEYLKNSSKKENYNPLVSIIIPSYNGKKYLKYAIESALNQTYKNIEIIIVNDGSKDNGATRRIAEKYKGKVSYYEKENGGVSSALNYGIEKMNGDFFAWLSHDDLMEKNHIEKLVEFTSIKGNEKFIPFSGFKLANENGTVIIDGNYQGLMQCFDYKKSLLHNQYSLLMGEINGGSVLIPREAFKKTKFDEERKITQERDMWEKLMKNYHFINIPFNTSIIRIHTEQVTNTNKNVIIETDKKNLEIIEEFSKNEILKLEPSIDEFYQKLIIFYKHNHREDIAKKIEVIYNKRKK